MDFPWLISAECTDTGRKRSHNEDSLLRLSGEGIFCVADGMGGALGGEIASRAVVDGLRQAFEGAHAAGTTATLKRRLGMVRQALNAASGQIKALSSDRGVSGMGTTAIVFVADPFDAKRAGILHAGDSRGYRFRGGVLSQLTRDHSVAEAAGVAHESALPSMFRGVVTRAVGLEQDVKTDETAVAVEPEDLFILCSDGLTRMVPDSEIEQILKANPDVGLATLGQRLVDAANRAGGLDNTTVILIRADALLPAKVAADAADDQDEAQPAEENQPAEPAAKAPPPAPAFEPEPEAHTDGGDFSGSAPDRNTGPGITDGVAPKHETNTDLFFGRTPFRSSPTDNTDDMPVSSDDDLTPVSAVFPTPIVSGELSKTTLPDSSSANGDSPTGSPGLIVGMAMVLACAIIAGMTFFGGTPGGGQKSEPMAAVAAAGKSSDADAACDALKADIRATLLTGRWGELDRKASDVRTRFPNLATDMPEWAVFEAWRKDWGRAESSKSLARFLFSDLFAASISAISIVQTDPPSVQPRWQGEPKVDADAYCAGAYALRQWLTDAIGRYATERVAEIAHAELDLMPVAVRLQEDISMTNAGTQEAFASLKISVADLAQWNGRDAVSMLPPSPATFGEAGAIVAAVERREDDLFDRLAAVIRIWGFAHMADLRSGDAAGSITKKSDIFALFNRTCHVRARFKTDVRAWRMGGGREDVEGFFRLVNGAFPEKRESGAAP